MSVFMSPEGLRKSGVKGLFLGLFICSVFLVCNLEVKKSNKSVAMGR